MVAQLGAMTFLLDFVFVSLLAALLTCLVTTLFNLLGFFVSIMIAESYAGKYGACFGLGLLFIVSGIFNLPFVLEETKSISKNVTVKAVSMSFLFIGFFICTLCIILYQRIRNEAARYNEITTVNV